MGRTALYPESFLSQQNEKYFRVKDEYCLSRLSRDGVKAKCDRNVRSFSLIV
jgi:hypothetical protein